MLLRIAAFVLAALFTAPAVLPAAQVRVGVTVGRNRVYDRDHHDYHAWNSGESRAYRQYLAERHLRYVRYARQRRVQQSAYWQWRHERLERERR
jgi:hypothetical protein